jgi:hypothetical protein
VETSSTPRRNNPNRDDRNNNNRNRNNNNNNKSNNNNARRPFNNNGPPALTLTNPLKLQRKVDQIPLSEMPDQPSHSDGPRKVASASDNGGERTRTDNGPRRSGPGGGGGGVAAGKLIPLGDGEVSSMMHDRQNESHSVFLCMDSLAMATTSRCSLSRSSGSTGSCSRTQQTKTSRR